MSVPEAHELEPAGAAPLLTPRAKQDDLGQTPPPAAPLGASGRALHFGKLTIETKDVYDLDERKGLFYEAVNALNVVVHEDVIQREVEAVFKPGDPYNPELIEEAERNLRALPFIATATITASVDDQDQVDVHVVTRDRLTVAFGASLAFFGGSHKFRASIAESDLFGYGKAFKVGYRTDEDKSTLEFKYSDPQLFNTDYRLDLKWADTTDGHDYQFELERPFKTLASHWSYGIAVGDSEFKTRFFDHGDEIAAVPVRRQETSLFLTRSYGTREELLRVGGKVTFHDDEYDAAEGDAASTISVPPDQRIVTFGPTLQADWLPRFEKRQRVDAIDAVEDIPIGLQLEAFSGLQHRGKADVGASNEIAVSTSALAIETIGENHLISLRAWGQFRQDGEPAGWMASSFLHYYYQGLPSQTLVVSAAADGSWENEDLRTEITLGEDNGLRGYPIRQFSGNKRLRFNVEDRIFTGLEILSVHIGAVAFFDAGMVWDRGETMRLSDLARLGRHRAAAGLARAARQQRRAHRLRLSARHDRRRALRPVDLGDARPGGGDRSQRRGDPERVHVRFLTLPGPARCRYARVALALHRKAMHVASADPPHCGSQARPTCRPSRRSTGCRCSGRRRATVSCTSITCPISTGTTPIRSSSRR
ncbi:MAG: POTRA domain-containing protein [Planctomycetota bacterium]